MTLGVDRNQGVTMRYDDSTDCAASEDDDRRTMATMDEGRRRTQYEPDDAEDSDEETRARRDEAFEAEIEAEVEAMYGKGSGKGGDGASWEAFWTRASRINEAKMRRAGLDPNMEDPKEKFGRFGQKLERGRPREGEALYCFGCDAVCDGRFECAQCLEIFRARSKLVPFDAWERAFFCAPECYKTHWREHCERHGPSSAGPTKLDGRVHQFEAPQGNGALWHTVELKRIDFEECVPKL